MLVVACQALAFGLTSPTTQQAPALSLSSHRHAPPRCGLIEDVLQEAKLVRGGAGLVEQPVFFDGNADDQPFDVERWEQHRSASRYTRLIPGILIGPTTQRVSGTVFALVTFAALVGLYNNYADMSDPIELSAQFGITSLPQIDLPITPFELTAPVLGLLLVFRTDTANGRFQSGCDAVWEITSSLRSLIRKLVAWAEAQTLGVAAATRSATQGSAATRGSATRGSATRGSAAHALLAASLCCSRLACRIPLLLAPCLPHPSAARGRRSDWSLTFEALV